jgi:hypothetical protein
MRHSADMSRLLRRCVAYLHTPQICGTCRGVKIGIHGLLNWTAANLYLGNTSGSDMVELSVAKTKRQSWKRAKNAGKMACFS